jgi:hypothetical protein
LFFFGIDQTLRLDEPPNTVAVRGELLKTGKYKMFYKFCLDFLTK